MRGLASIFFGAAAWKVSRATVLSASRLRQVTFDVKEEVKEEEPEPEPEPGPITEELIYAANKYAELYPHRITFIRKHGGVPHYAAFKLTDKELIHAILHADTPELNALNPKPKVYPPDDPRSRHDFV